MGLETILAGLGWLLAQTQILSHVAQRLVERRIPAAPEQTPLPEQPEQPTPQGAGISGPVADRLLVPPPGRLMFVRDEPGPSRPLLAVVCSDGPSGWVQWRLERFDEPIDLDLPETAIALLPLLIHVDGQEGQSRVALSDFQFSGTVHGYQIYAVA